MRRKSDFDTEVAAQLGISRDKVSLITGAFLQTVRNTIVEDGVAMLDRFGKFKAVAYQGGRRGKLEGDTKKVVPVPIKLRVHFSKAQGFKEQLHEAWAMEGNPMEKYGVDESVDQKNLEKQASEGCPKCSRELVKHGSVLMCPTCGTEPFEQPNQDGNS